MTGVQFSAARIDKNMLKIIIFLVATVLTASTVLGDILLKKATLSQKPASSILIIAAALIWGVSAYGWFWILKKMEFLDAGVIFSMGALVLGALVSVFIFKEHLAFAEIIGLILAVISIFLMVEFV
ncbi:MAG: hypothetical protein PHC85_02960 [Candidatus Pacebacteria bacterium]|nr:hypothetical protein [Candidatus Paceibacterota bacterium]